MMRTGKRLLWCGILAAGVTAGWGFALLGPFNEDYQVPDLGYNLVGDIGAPKNWGEEYRRNLPTNYYAFDQSFLDYYGSNGVYAVERAFAILNALARTNLSDYSPTLEEFPLTTRGINYRAAALGLIDLTSTTLSLLMEQMGLAEPERYTWTLHNRNVGPGGCPEDVFYIVTKRNFEIVPGNFDTLLYSSYVNGVLFSYSINERCSPPRPPAAEAVEIRVDVLNDPFTAVASFNANTVDTGGFFTGLTRDDVAGLRYLMRAGNVNWEAAGTNVVAYHTNTVPGALQLLFPSNLTQLAEAALTNDAPALQALFPNLVVLSTVPYITNVVSSNIVAYYTNAQPWEPPGPPRLVFATNAVTNVVFHYRHHFANVRTNVGPFPIGQVTVLTTNVAPPPYAPAGTPPQTNVTLRTMWTNILMGSYYIIPTNLCDVLVLSNVFTRVDAFTNTPVLATNLPVDTNQFYQEYSISYVTYFTNTVLAVFPVECATNAVTLRRGIERVYFERRDYDSLLGRFFNPVTNVYRHTIVTNSQNRVQTLVRVIEQPDFLFTAQDLAPGPADPPDTVYPVVVRTISFNSDQAIPTLAGPGTIENPVRVTFDKAGPIFYNRATNNIYFLDERSAVRRFLMASFDDSTNAPVLFPNGRSIEALENQLLLDVLVSVTFTNRDTNGVWVSLTNTLALPEARVGRSYPPAPTPAPMEYPIQVAFTGSGGAPPYAWSLAPGSPGLPPGLTLHPVTGVLSGVPTTDGVYDFVIRVTDAGARYLDRPFELRVRP